MLIDSHCHLTYDKPEWGGLEAALARAKARGVTHCLTIGCSRSDFMPVQDLAARFENVYCSVGIHPHEVEATLKDTSVEGVMAELDLCCQNPKVIGLGETGLDYYYEHSPRDLQRRLFEEHIRLALRLDLPLIIHTRDGEEETIDILKEVGQGRVKGVIHCFSGSSWLMEESLKLGLYISVSGIVTFKKAVDLQETLSKVPLERMLVETDAPYLAPVPYRGKVNEPSFVEKTAHFMADLKGVSFEELAQKTTDNFFTLFSRARA